LGIFALFLVKFLVKYIILKRRGELAMSRRGENIFRRKDGRWEARYVKEVALDGTKKYGSVYAKTYHEVKEKQQICINLPTASPSKSCLTVNETMIEWLAESKNQLKISSYQKYSATFENHISKRIGELPLKYITPKIITQFTDTLLNDDKLSRETANLVLIVLGMGLNLAKERYKVVVPEIHLLRTGKVQMRVLSETEYQVLVQHLLSQSDIYSFGMLLALCTGLRIGEVCALRWEDISGSTLHVSKTMQRLKNSEGITEVMILPPKTNSSDRIIPIPSALRESINQHRKESGYILSRKNGGFTEPRLLQNKFSRCLAECGIEKATFHTLRHTFATRCIEAGVDVKTLSELLGHSDVKTTLNKYVHSSFELKQKSIDKLPLTT